jgi:hypothetical protein
MAQKRMSGINENIWDTCQSVCASDMRESRCEQYEQSNSRIGAKQDIKQNKQTNSMV